MSTTPEHIFSVYELNHMSRELLETAFANVWIEGEISNFVVPQSGHWYFSLKDEKAQIRCACFKGNNRSIKFQVESGMHVIVRAKVSIFEGRGDFQLIVNKIEEVGFGALQRAFEQLKIKLQKEGLFAEEHKKPIPEFPKKLGVVTSATGAAIKDILSVLKRRFPGLPIIIYPTMVQGDAAAAQIATAIALANERNECDILIVSRGGGSIEDLWPFNEEIVARAIFNSEIPIVTGVGHEIDFTIADFVADQRAPTPSAAAELVSPNKNELIAHIQKLYDRLQYSLRKHLEHLNVSLNNTAQRLKRCHPMHQLQEKTQHVDRLEHALIAAQKHILEQKQNQLKILARALHAISPLATLGRGYAIVTDNKGNVIQQSQDVKIGEKINTRLLKGELQCTVNKIKN